MIPSSAFVAAAAIVVVVIAIVMFASGYVCVRVLSLMLAAVVVCTDTWHASVCVCVYVMFSLNFGGRRARCALNCLMQTPTHPHATRAQIHIHVYEGRVKTERDTHNIWRATTKNGATHTRTHFREFARFSTTQTHTSSPYELTEQKSGHEMKEKGMIFRRNHNNKML